jgi:RNase P subunit RPR2
LKPKRKEEVIELAKEILQYAINNARDDYEVANKLTQAVRRILMKFNLRLGYEWRRFICHGCKNLIVPGVNARVRISSQRRAVITTCLSCGKVNRKILGQT